MLWKITTPEQKNVFYVEDAKKAQYYAEQGHTVERYTKASDNYRETKSPIFDVILTEENCGQVIADMLMECAERLGNFPKAQIDALAWYHILVYALKYICAVRAAEWTFDPANIYY